MATLTGACAVALGSVATGLMTNDDALGQAIIAAGERAGEKIWQLPMFEEYDKQIASDVADVKNTGGRYAGAITAAKSWPSSPPTPPGRTWTWRARMTPTRMTAQR